MGRGPSDAAPGAATAATADWDMWVNPSDPLRAPLDERRPGGLGLHLIRRMVDSVEYTHEGRTGRIVFRKRFAKRKG